MIYASFFDFMNEYVSVEPSFLRQFHLPLLLIECYAPHLILAHPTLEGTRLEGAHDIVLPYSWNSLFLVKTVGPDSVF